MLFNSEFCFVFELLVNAQAISECKMLKVQGFFIRHILNYTEYNQ